MRYGKTIVGCVVALAGLAGLPPEAAAQAGCDLTVQFTAPQSPAPRIKDLGVGVKLKNQGTAPCNKNRVSVNAFNGATATGYARTVGGSGGGQELPALAPGDEVTLDYTDNVAAGRANTKITYKVKYASPHNDANNGNHLPTHTVTLQ